MNKNIFYFLLSFLFYKSTMAQKEKDSLLFGIHFKWKTENLERNKKYVSKKDTLQINLLKFYLSGIEIEYSDKTTFIEKNSYHLIDIENPKSLQIPICKKNGKVISKIKFKIGVDSLSSVSGAMSGDLELQNGMYWAWHSGYINIKIEGKSSSCKTRKNEFQFHIGGYQKPNYALRNVEIPILKAQIPNDDLQLNVAIEKLFSEISLKETNSIMIPGKKAMEIADLLQQIFSIE
jgi:hypothetical protein